MAALPYMQLYVADYLADTAHLTAAQHGAYLLLMFNYWQRGKPLNNANERLTNVARMSNEEWLEAKPALAEFFEIDGDEWRHARIDRDLEAVNSKASKASNAGKASAASKANKRSTNVEQPLNHTDVDVDTDTDTEADKTKTKTPRAPRFDAQAHLVASKLPTCPQKEILALYAELLPELPQPRIWEGARQKNLAARWKWAVRDLAERGKPCDTAAGVDFFRRMFRYVAKSEFLTGQPGPWCASLDWLVESGNFAKVIAGNYDNKAAA